MPFEKMGLAPRASFNGEIGITFYINADVGENVDIRDFPRESDEIILICGFTIPRDYQYLITTTFFSGYQFDFIGNPLSYDSATRVFE